MDYIIKPKNNWVEDKFNLTVADAIYKSLIPMVNAGKLNYYNFTSGTGWFEEKSRANLNIDFLIRDSEEAEIEYLQKVELSVINSNSEIFSIMQNIQQKFDLERVEVNGS